MKSLLTSLAMLLSTVCISQTVQQQATADFNALKNEYDSKLQEYVTAKSKLNSMVTNFESGIDAQATKTKKLQNEVAALYQKYVTIKKYYEAKGLTAAQIEGIYNPEAVDSPADTTQHIDEKTVYLLYGDKEVAKENIFKDEPEAEAAFKKAIGGTGSADIGTFEIPGEKQKIQLYDQSFSTVANSYVLFKKVRFSLRDGNIYDIRITVVDSNSQTEYHFENKVPISLLNYMRESNRNYLTYRRSVPLANEIIGSDPIRNYMIRISDVLGYLPTPGNNHVPDDDDYTFPTDNGVDTTESAERRVYKVLGKSNLKNVLDLRTYTDFLGLFGKGSNGLVQIEGKADFYINPFQVGRVMPLNYLKKISPYVLYSRLDEDDRGLTLLNDNPETDRVRIRRPLEVIEKTFLDMGSLVDVVSLCFRKESPIRWNLYYAMRYQAANITREEEDDDVSFKTFGNGVGIRAEVYRFNNFGFIYSPEFTYYNNITREDFLETLDNFWVFRNEAEVFYYPGSDRHQSIFLRLRTFLNVSDGEDSFFQLQFGYRFSIGLGDVKSREQ